MPSLDPDEKSSELRALAIRARLHATIIGDVTAAQDLHALANELDAKAAALDVDDP